MKNKQNIICNDMLAPIYKDSPVMVDATGVSLIDETGKEYIDLNEMCLVLGQKNKDYINSITKALHGITSLKDGSMQKKKELYDYFAKTTNGDFKAAHLTTSGSEAVEWAVRLAKKITGRSEIISFWNSIHGRTYLTSSLSGLPRRKVEYGLKAPGIMSTPYPQCNECEFEGTCGNGNFRCIDFIQKQYNYSTAHDVAAIIIEPYLGSCIAFPPKGYIKALYDWAKSKDMFFIMDEVQSAMGRTGQMYCYQQEGIKPDMLVLGKALGNGMHISALLVREQPPDNCLPAISGGVGDELIACSAACEVFRQLENGLLDHINEVGKYIEKEMQTVKSSESVSNVRGRGLVWAVEFKDLAISDMLFDYLKCRGFLIGHVNNFIYIKPPYVITKEQIKQFIDVLKEAIGL